MIRALRRLDPSGLTLDAVSERVRAYLKLRPDTVKQIVTTLTDPDSSDLLEPVGGGAAAEVVQEAAADGDMAPDPDESRGDEAAMLKWEPEPVTADGASSGGAAARRAPDVLAILVQIYGSKATFVNEFRKMLSEKLLASASHDTEKEVRNLELLKKRFGDAALSACEVMLTDVAESRRISRSIQQHFGGVSGGGEGATLIDATVVSRLCWPSLPTDTFTLPAGVKKEMARFEKQFAHIKAPRKLVWKPSLGTVTLDVTFPDGSVGDVQCKPLQATILLRFGAQQRWALADLASELGIATDVVRKNLSIWLNRGFISEVRDAGGGAVFEAATSLGAGDESRHDAGEDEDGDAVASLAEEQRIAEMKVYEQYVIGMLTNLESLPVQRIHNMLKMFVPASGGDRGYDCSEQELQRFLMHMVEEAKLEHSAGQYRIAGRH
mmetsp:Transcript_16786/g.55061  ORF Transcript_16786/g.55061 Transcript_16786/m.55061 type:complete len:437 (+) Transcript_16786:656-1966(+)